MNIEKALSILGLTGNPTQEEIKRSYRSLAVEHHPDNFMGAKDEVRSYHEEKMKEINNAYEFLQKNYNFSKDTDFDLYRNNIINKMNSYWRDTKVETIELFTLIRELANYYCLVLLTCISKDVLDNVYEQFLKDLKIKYDNYRKEFYKDNYIDENDVKETINYNLKVDDFYKQLENIKNKYSKEAKFKKLVHDLIETYRFCAHCNNHIWKLISEACAKNALINARNAKFQNNTEVLQNMHKEIEDLIKLVDEINNMFDKINEELKNINDKELKQEYKNLENKYYEGQALDDIKRDLINLNNKIDEYKKENARLIKMEKDSPLVDNLYHIILNNYNNALTSLNPIVDADRIKDIMEFYMLVMNSFVRYSVGLIDIDRLLTLKEITFKDMIKDKELLNVVFYGKTIVNRLKIYLKKRQFYKYMFDTSSFFILREENGKFFMKNMTIKDQEEIISAKKVEKEYVSLDEVMKSAIYQGYICLYSNAIEVQNLYGINVYGNYRYITLKDGIFSIASYGTLSDPIATCSDEFKDKEYLKEMIESQLREKLEENKTR